MRGIQAILLLCLLTCALLAGPGVESMELRREQWEDLLLLLINRERESQGVPALRCDPLLRELARAHSRKMARENALEHDFAGYDRLAQRAAAAGVSFAKLGENVVRSDTSSMHLYHQAFLASPGHRRNILDNEFTHVGIGIEQSGTMMYITQEFARLLPLRPAPGRKLPFATGREP